MENDDAVEESMDVVRSFMDSVVMREKLAEALQERTKLVIEKFDRELNQHFEWGILPEIKKKAEEALQKATSEHIDVVLERAYSYFMEGVKVNLHTLMKEVARDPKFVRFVVAEINAMQVKRSGE